jgi:hypothetical protein
MHGQIDRGSVLASMRKNLQGKEKVGARSGISINSRDLPQGEQGMIPTEQI